jgi:hypothetical protein
MQCTPMHPTLLFCLMADNFICEGESAGAEWVNPLIKWQCTLMHPTLVFYSVLRPGNFTHQVESAATQWVKWNIILILIASNKGDSPLWHNI